MEGKERFRVLKRFSQVMFYLKFSVVLKSLQFFCSLSFFPRSAFLSVLLCNCVFLWLYLAEIGRVRKDMYNDTLNSSTDKRTSELPDAVGPIAQLQEKLYVPVKEYPDVSGIPLLILAVILFILKVLKQMLVILTQSPFRHPLYLYTTSNFSLIEYFVMPATGHRIPTTTKNLKVRKDKIDLIGVYS